MAATWTDYFTGRPGRWFLNRFVGPAELAGFFWVCLRTIFQLRGRGRKLLAVITIQQVYFTAVQAFWIVSAIALALGAVIVMQGLENLSRVGAQEVLYQLLIVGIIRELGPLLTAVVLILRSGSAIAIEMGYMTVLGEIESLEMSGVHPLHLLAGPRLVGMTISMICLYVVFSAVATVGSFMVVRGLELVPVSLWTLTFGLARSLVPADLIVGLAKSVYFGAVISITCLYYGLSARGAVTAIPQRTSAALVSCFAYCFFGSGVISAIFYL